MTASQIKQSILKRHLQLEGMAKLTHFEPVLWLLFVAAMFPAFVGYEWLRYGEVISLGLTLEMLLIFSLIPTALALCLYIYQTRQLRLWRIITSRSVDENRDIVIDTANRNDWKIRNNRKNFMMLKTHPSFWSGSWGEQITLILDGRDIWLNSICDPENHTSIVSMGRNRQNIEILTHALSS